MTRILTKRHCLHKELAAQQQHNSVMESQIAQLEQLANIGTAAYMIAHEINNLLGPLAGYAGFALNNPEDKTLTEKALQKAVKNCERASKIMQSMLAMANDKSAEKQSSRLINLVEEIFTCLCRDFAKDSITVEIDVPEDLTVWAVPVQIQQVLMNLILNARQAMLPRGGMLTIKGHENAQFVEIEVSDTGAGIERDDLKKIFKAFYTTKADVSSTAAGRGCGLGLAFCKKIIDEHRGSICVDSKPSEGTSFKIALPKPH